MWMREVHLRRAMGVGRNSANAQSGFSKVVCAEEYGLKAGGVSVGPRWHNPVGVENSALHLPRVARSSQPWAGGHNPVGIEDPCKIQRGRKYSDAFTLALLTAPSVISCSPGSAPAPANRALPARAIETM